MRIDSTRPRINLTLIAASGIALGAALLVVPPPGRAADPAASLRAEVERLRDRVLELERTVAAVTEAAASVERRTACMSAIGTDTFFTGCNVHIRDGSGDTEGAINGLGNLIVGYNEAFVPGSRRTGSHNLVIGPEHSYTSYGGLVAGFYNTVSAPHASVTGGAFNSASMNRATVAGGERNEAGALGATVTGGSDNLAAGEHALVAGGSGNAARGDAATVAGGAMNSAPGKAAVVSGGSGNRAEGMYASVNGGELNQALALNAAVAGGSSNRASGKRSSIAGGTRLSAAADDASMAGAGTFVARATTTEPADADAGRELAAQWRRPHPYAPDPDAVAGSRPGAGRWSREAWADTAPAPAAEAGSAFGRTADNPFKLEGRDFNPGVGSPFAE